MTTCLLISGVALCQTPPISPTTSSDTQTPKPLQTAYCQNHVNDKCCGDDAKGVAACFYAWRTPGNGAPGTVTAGVVAPVTGPIGGLPPVTAGITRPQVLDTIMNGNRM